MKKILSLILCAIILCALLPGCSGTAAPNSTVTVIATDFAPYDLARAIAGERAKVTMLLPPGAESHSYEPTPKDIIAIQSCSLFVYVGGESDAWVANVLADVGDGVPAVTLMDCVDKLYEEELVPGMENTEEEAGGEAEYDEHVWTSPRNAELICEKLCEALCEIDPGGQSVYEFNLASTVSELTKLDEAFQAVVDAKKRNTLVFADRFPLRYFVEAYGLDYCAAFPGCADETEPSAATVAFIEDKVKEEGIPVVFHIELSNEDLANEVSAATGALKLQWNACHNITRKQLEDGVTYIGLMWENVDALKEALW